MASRGVNIAIIEGRVGGEPDIRVMPSGDSVANFSIATNESWVDKETGAAQERVTWHRIVVFGRLADAIVKPYVHKGTTVFVRGHLRNRSWTGQDQIERTQTEVIVDMNGQLQLFGGPPTANAAPATGATEEAPPF